MLALKELCEQPAAFSRVDEHGWYPLHRAAVQPLVQVLEMVLYGEWRIQTRGSEENWRFRRLKNEIRNSGVKKRLNYKNKIKIATN